MSDLSVPLDFSSLIKHFSGFVLLPGGFPTFPREFAITHGSLITGKSSFLLFPLGAFPFPSHPLGAPGFGIQSSGAEDNLMANIDRNHGIVEHSELEELHKDHLGQLLPALPPWKFHQL